MFAPTNSYWNKKTNTSIWHSGDAITLTGFSTAFKQKWTANSANRFDTIISVLTGTQNKNSNTSTAVPYSKGLSESFRNMCMKVGVQVHFMGANTVKELLVAPRTRTAFITREKSSIDTDVANQGVSWNT